MVVAPKYAKRPLFCQQPQTKNTGSIDAEETLEFNQAELDQFRNSQKPYAKQKRESRVWRTLRTWDKFAFFLYVIAFLLLVTSILLFAVPTLTLLFAELGLLSLLPTALFDIPDMILFQMATGAFIASVLLLLLARWRVLHNRSLRPECGCPVCHERELIRVPRKSRDRMFSFIGVTAWRYACRNCTWGGLRVGGQRPLPASTPTKATPVAVNTESSHMSALDSTFEEVVYESKNTDLTIESDISEIVIEAESAAEEAPLASLSELEFVEEDAMNEVTEETVESFPEPLKVAELDESKFDSEFERLCYEAAQAK